jgi:cytochrome c556
MLRSVIAIVAIACSATAVLAQETPIEVRQKLMKRNNEHAKTVSAMAKGEAAFDAAKVNAAYTDWTDTAKKLPDLFPDNSKTGNKTRAKPEIWTNAADFKVKIADFAKVVADTKTEASTAAGVKTAFSKLIKACDGCHDTFRASRQP